MHLDSFLSLAEMQLRKRMEGRERERESEIKKRIEDKVDRRINNDQRKRDTI